MKWGNNSTYLRGLKDRMHVQHLKTEPNKVTSYLKSKRQGK